MALKKNAAAARGRGHDDAPPAGADAPGNEPAALTISQTAVAEPIVVANALWRSSDPNAYQGGLEPDVTHLREVEESGIARYDNARWSGALDVIPTKADYVLDLIRANSLWPLLSGLACCAMEMMSSAADVLIVAGTLTTKMAGPLLRLWEQMPEPKWCVAMGDCTCSGGRYKRSYSTIEGIDRVMPVDIYVPGCPPRPEGLIYGMMKLQQLVKDRRGHWPDRAVGPTVPEDV